MHYERPAKSVGVLADSVGMVPVRSRLFNLSNVNLLRLSK